MSNTDPEIHEASSNTGSPFEVEKVDALVFRKSSDAPETRAAAAKIQQYLDVAPPPKRFQNLRPQSPVIDGPWVPLDTVSQPLAADPESGTTSAKPGSRVKETIFTSIVTIIPMVLIFMTVVLVYRWFGFA